MAPASLLIQKTINAFSYDYILLTFWAYDIIINVYTAMVDVIS